MQTHPKISKDIIASNVMLAILSDWICYHHERVDGTGYYKVKEEDIPFEAKILSVADCYSAMTTDRAYHKGKTHEKTIEILKSISGSQLDKDLVDIFVEIEIEDIIKCVPDEMYKRDKKNEVLDF